MRELDSIISKIRKEYLELLKSISIENINSNCVGAIIDEINVFWERHRRELLFMVQYLSSKDYDTCFFSGAAGIEISDGEHIPFILATKYKIYDDKLHGYFKALKFDSLPDFVIDEIKYLIRNNIELLETNLDIMIFPIVHYYIEPQEISDFADRVFLSFFDYKYDSIDDFLQKAVTESDVESNVNTFIGSSFMLSNKEKSSSGIIEKINLAAIDAVAKNCHSFGEKAYFTIKGVLFNSLSIIAVAMKTGFLPYLRNKVAFNNVYILLDSFITQSTDIEKELPNFRYYVIGLRMLYNEFANYELATIDYEKLIKLKDFLYFSDFFKNRIGSLPVGVNQAHAKDFADISNSYWKLIEVINK